MSDSEGEAPPAQQEAAGPPPDNRPGANTGIKGVLADYADAKNKMHVAQRAEAKEGWAQLDKRGITAATIEEQETMAVRAVEAQNAELGDKNDDSDDSDDEFMAQYRAKRLEQIKEEQLEAMRSAYRPSFGSLVSLSADSLVDEIERQHPDTFIIVHLHDNSLELCHRLNSIFSSLAVKLAYTMFCKVSAADASESLSVEALPTVIVFRGGEQIRTWVRFDVPLKPLNEEIVTAWLLKEQVLTLDDEQRDKLTVDGKAFNFDDAVQLIDPTLLRKLTEILR